MQIIEEIKLDFCDVLIRPKRSNAPSRASIELNRTFKTLNSQQEISGVPIIVANMATTGTIQMAKKLSGYDCFVCLHKFYDIDNLVDYFASKTQFNDFYTMGIRDEDFEKLFVLREEINQKTDGENEFPYHLCVDVANGYSKYFVDKVRKLRDLFPKTIIMAGNVATSEMTQELLISGGADIIKIGIGGGSSCITRKITGVGFPQLSSVSECAESAHGLGGHICADGGIVDIGDFSKAYCAGADFVMAGGFFAGTDECEGEWIEEDGVKKLKFYGMSSEDALEKHYGGKADYRTPEGKSVYVKAKGSVDGLIKDILGGLRSTGTYIGASRLKDFSKCCTFIKVNRTHNTIFGV